MSKKSKEYINDLDFVYKTKKSKKKKRKKYKKHRFETSTSIFEDLIDGLDVNVNSIVDISANNNVTDNLINFVGKVITGAAGIKKSIDDFKNILK